MGLFRKKRQIDLEERSPELGIKLKDLLVLEQMAKHGADLTQPRHVVHYLYFDDEVVADTVAAQVDAPFQTGVHEPIPEYPGSWRLICEAHDYTLSPGLVRDNSDYFEALAERHGGTYDGWEACI